MWMTPMAYRGAAAATASAGTITSGLQGLITVAAATPNAVVGSTAVERRTGLSGTGTLPFAPCVDEGRKTRTGYGPGIGGQRRVATHEDQNVSSTKHPGSPAWRPPV
jgi:WhiB family transcriptional regulator, redox-sensing transcriptional regulator